MGERKHRTCPGINECCYAEHKQFLNEFTRHSTVTIEYKSGRKLSIPSLAFIEEGVERDGSNRNVWLSYLSESSEIVEIQLTDWQNELTPESQQLLWDFHPGLHTTPLNESCHFNK